MQTATCICHQPPGRVDLRSVKLRAPAADELLLENLWSGVSPGTESRALRGQQAGAPAGPFVPGYQAVGRVLSAGKGSGFTPGEGVFHTGGQDFGTLASLWGAHASHALVKAAAVYRCTAALMPEMALTKLAAIAHHGLEAGEIRHGERVAVVGLGMLGQLSARLARMRGAEVVAFDRSPERVQAARDGGIEAYPVSGSLAESARAAGWPGREFDVLVDVTGVVAVLDEVVGLARELSPWDAPVAAPTRLVIQGSYAGRASFDYQQAFLKQMSFIVPRDHTRSDVETVLPLIAAGDLALKGLAGPVVAPSEAAAVYRELGTPGAERLTAIFNWS